MSTTDVAAALERVAAVLRRRPSLGLQDDAPALATWTGGLHVVASHANGTRVDTDLPVELGGSGSDVSPGWLFRASIASCAAARIAMGAAQAGIELTRLEVSATSRSDTRGLLGLADAQGATVDASPRQIELRVVVAARDALPERLRELVERAQACSPMVAAVARALDVRLTVEIAAR